MSFFSYEGVPNSVLDKQHTTSTGETYSLRHNENLKVEMSYLGKGNTNANSQGWERNSSKYFEALYRNHPEMFSKKNVVRIKDGHAPIVDQKMISSNPNWAQYRNQALVHHHIGGDGEAVAIPKNAHKGQGEIHNHEKSAGITDNCRSFSKKCASNPNSVGKTTSQLHAEIGAKSKSNGKTQSTLPAKISNASRTSKSSISASARSDAVRSSVSSKGSSSNTGRSQSVRDAGSSMNTSSSPSRGDSVRSSMQSTKSGSVGQTSTQSSVGSAHSHASSSSSASQGSSHGAGQSSGGGSSRGGYSGGSGQGK